MREGFLWVSEYECVCVSHVHMFPGLVSMWICVVYEYDMVGTCKCVVEYVWCVSMCGARKYIIYVYEAYM